MFAKKSITRIFSVLFVIVFMLSVTPLQAAHAAGTRYAKPSATGTGNCSSWANACTLQTALTGATSGDEIWVMTGTHKPTTGSDRSATFQLRNGVAVYGGFAGTETARSQRNPLTNVTTLSGDLSGDDVGFTYNSENVYHVVTGNGTDATAILDGFTISGGNANAGTTPGWKGGGMINDGGSPTVSNITFTGNYAYYGGGMVSTSAGSPLLTNITFSGNTAVHGGGMLDNGSSPTLTNITFGGNTTTDTGGGMENWASSPTLTDVTFSGNTAATYGGGMYNITSSSPELTDVTFSNNSATEGGGMYNDSSNPTLTNVTFSGNSASDLGGGMLNTGSNPTILNSILWDDTAGTSGAEIYNATTSTPVITYSDIDGIFTGTGNINTDPLLGSLGNYGGSTQVFPLLPGSPAINTGDPSNCPPTDQRGVSRPQGAYCDMGAFEFIPGPLYAAAAGLTSGACNTWPNACDLPYALSIAGPGNEIWAKAGTYTPTTSTDRSATFQLRNSVAVYGGFAGTETARSQRDPAAHPTLLSGNIGAAGDASDNSYHVVTGSGTDLTASLDGFTISGGNANYGAHPDDSGGGMINDAGSPTLSNLIFDNNHANWVGGGMDNNSSNPTLTNVTFSGNSDNNHGGGMYNNSSNPTLTDVTFSGNSANYGGGMDNYSSTPTLTEVTFKGNSATTSGGGMYNFSNTPTLTDVTFSGNSANYGGGMYNYSSNLTLTEVTFGSNSATTEGGGIYNFNSSPTIRNSILWGNTAPTGPQIYNDSSTPTISYSNIEGDCPVGSTCDHITISNPQFVDAASGNLHLQLTSPAIDAGNNAYVPLDTLDLDGDGNTSEPLPYDLDGSPRFWDIPMLTDSGSGTAPIVDLGAYEARLIFVKASASGADNGTTWANAYTHLQSALSTARPGNEIWVTAGTYKPTTVADRTATFQLKSGVAVYGGFAGAETARSQRSPTANVTVLSGDIGVASNASDNSYNVVTGSGTDATTVLDGFTITGGHANAGTSPGWNGGGMVNDHGSPTLANLIFDNNFAQFEGGGIYNNYSSPTLTDVTFSGNSSANRGGGMDNYHYSSPTLTNVTFKGNSVGSEGGGMYNFRSSPTLTNVTFSGNSAYDDGGGMSNYYNSNLTLTNVTFSGNTSPTMGGGMANFSSSNPTIRNSILWGNTAPADSQIGSYISSITTISYSDIQGGCPAGSTCDHITTSDPLFINAAAGNLHLQLTSPAIDAGNNSYVPLDTLDLDGDGNTSEPLPYDLDGSLRFWDNPIVADTGSGTAPLVDLGAYEARGIFVDASATSGANNGATWANAYTHLQSALSTAAPGNEIWVAAGTYKPTTVADRAATFQLKSGVAVYGGFAGTETARSQRSPATNLTILSGDLSGNDVGFTNNGENSYHVVTGSDTDNTAVLDGFTIMGGNANGADEWGGGMVNDAGSPTLTDVTFSNNSAIQGGGMRNTYSSPTLTDVTFNNNHAVNGGGMQNIESNPTLTNVTFSGNSTSSSGGGMVNDSSSSPTLTDVTFNNNSASSGGGMFNIDSSNPTLTDITFSGNSATNSGGGMVNINSCSPTLTNVTFSGNSATNRGGGMVNTNSSSSTIRNSILWGNTAPTGPQIDNSAGTATISYSDIQGGYAGTGNINTDPLLGTLGNYGGSTQVIPLLPGSPAIDAGDPSNCPATDQRGVSRPQGTRCDMGAFESQGFTLAITGGNNQSAARNSGFVNPLSVSVTPFNPVEPVNGGHVTFTAPGSGASAVISGSPATISGGSASVTATANNTLGTYNITAGTTGASPISFSLHNIGKAPTNIALSNHTIAENQPVHTLVGTFSTTDPDSGDTFTYSLVTGSGATDNASFSITGNQLLTAASFNFEAKSSYSVRIRTTDHDGLWYEKAFTISVTDVNEAPVIISNGGGATASVSVAENSTAVTTVTATDPDAGATKTYSISGGADSARFSINASSGALAFASAPNFESPTDVGANNVYDVTVRVSDGSLTDSQAIAVTVTNVNEAPVITEGTSTHVNMSEDGSPTPFSLTLHATDVDAGNTITWSILSQAGHGTASASGMGTSKAITYTPTLHYIGSDSFVVQVSDGHGGTNTITVNVTIAAVGPPSFTVYLPLIQR